MKENPKLYDELEDGEEASLETIYERHRNCFDLAGKLLKLAREILPLEKTINHTLPKRVEVSLLALYTQAFRLFRSIILLCKCGFDTEALILFRSLLEVSAILLYVAEKDQDDRLMRYYHSYQISRYFGLKQLLKEFPETEKNMHNDTPERLRKQAEKSLQYFRNKNKVKKQMTDKAVVKKYVLRPYVPAEELNKPELKRMWRVTYPITSRVAHGHDLTEFIKLRENGSKIDLQIQPTDGSIPAALINSMRLVFWDIDQINSLLQLGKGTEIEVLDKDAGGFFSSSDL